MTERSEAKADGARLQANSGRGKHRKADATMSGTIAKYVVDYKEYAKGFRLTPEIWAKLNTDAWQVDTQAEGILKLVIGTDTPIRVAVVDWDHFMALNQEITELQDFADKCAYVLDQMPVDLDDLLEGFDE